jgi:hypothetical protein
MAGVGFACVYSERQDLGCNEVDDPGSIEFVFIEGSVETAEKITACFKDREYGPFTNVNRGEWAKIRARACIFKNFLRQ